METKEKSFTLYDMRLEVYKGKKVKKGTSLKSELLTILGFLSKRPILKRRLDDSVKHKIYYLEHCDFIEVDNMIDLIFVSAKYNHVTEVIDTKTLTSRGRLKRKIDGDKEKTHMTIKFEDDNTATFILENNYVGIKAKKIERYLNKMADILYSEKEIFKGYRIFTSIIPNNQFLDELEKMSKISLVKFIVDKEDIGCSDFADMSERSDIRGELEIIAKPKFRGTIKKSTVKEYYEKKTSNNVIKRIIVDGDDGTGSIHLDSELMKTKHNRTVEVESDTGLVKSNSIFAEFHKILLGED